MIRMKEGNLRVPIITVAYYIAKAYAVGRIISVIQDIIDDTNT